ncbi:MAG: hypothetical protein CVU57_20480 [Deltaproteobacteria bacterium HGW-Deltaproteobacteria-15]|nr:MAG: hypothetical protein CVU57_20480 [Deltaproteobacteria bacterium HGW-Deltaproteobacteria-15]
MHPKGSGHRRPSSRKTLTVHRNPERNLVYNKASVAYTAIRVLIPWRSLRSSKEVWLRTNRI